MQARTPYPRLPHSTSRHPHRLAPSTNRSLSLSLSKRLCPFLCPLHPRACNIVLCVLRAYICLHGEGLICACAHEDTQTSHARAITNVGRSQLHRFIAVTADLRRGRDKSKTKKKRGGRKGGEEIEITASRLPRGW